MCPILPLKLYLYVCLDFRSWWKLIFHFIKIILKIRVIVGFPFTSIETCIKKSQFNLFINFYAFKNILCSGIEMIYIKLLATFSGNSFSAFLYLLAWKRITLFNKYCEQLAPNITWPNLYLVTSEISLKMSSNHKNL